MGTCNCNRQEDWLSAFTLIFNTYSYILQRSQQLCSVAMFVWKYIFRKKGMKMPSVLLLRPVNWHTLVYRRRLWFVVLINIICLVYDYKAALNLKGTIPTTTTYDYWYCVLMCTLRAQAEEQPMDME